MALRPQQDGSRHFGPTTKLVVEEFLSGGNFGHFVCRGNNPHIDADYLVQGGYYFIASPGVVFGLACGFDSTEGGFLFVGEIPGASQCETGAQGGHLLWGSGHRLEGVIVGEGCQLVYDITAPSVTGAKDFTLSFLGSQTTSSPWDPTANSGAGAYLKPVPNTWANLAAPIVKGGMGGDAHNVAKNAHITQRHPEPFVNDPTAGHSVQKEIMTARYVLGEFNGAVLCHSIDPLGPDSFQVIKRELPNLLCFHKTLCGRHYGARALENAPDHLTACPECATPTPGSRNARRRR
jgi:hypothetical protein